MNDTTMMAELQAQKEVCSQILNLVHKEHQDLSVSEDYRPSTADPARKDLLKRLSDSLHSIRRQRLAWQSTVPALGSRSAQLDNLLKSNLDLIMRIIVLERENEQLLVRRGLMPPGRVPGVQPHFVSDMYRRTARV